MTRTQSISVSYGGLDDAAFGTLADNILLGLADNPHYAKPPQPLAELRQLLDDLAAAALAMKTGLKAATPQRDFARAQAEAAFKNLSTYAAGATPGRPDLWATANFPLTKAETTPRAASQPITGLTLTDGPSAHTLQASADAQTGMYAYVWRLYPRSTPAEQLAAGYCYRVCVSRLPRVLLDGLNSGTAYCVECAAWNDTGALQWSAPVSRIVQ